MRIDMLTLFPAMCEAVLSESIVGRARQEGLGTVACQDSRAYNLDIHRRVDDYPYGGGMGMLLQPQPIYDCFEAVCRAAGSRPHLIHLSPQGTVFTERRAVELSKMEHIAFLCGHYEGIDERVIEELVDEEISLGDFVLTGGELPALAVADAVLRLVPGVLADELSFTEESHFSGLLEYPQYTRPPVWHGREVPGVLLSGHHKNIADWRREQSLRRTIKRRPDLMESFVPDRLDQKLLEQIHAREKSKNRE